MKRLLAMALSLAMMVSMASCGSKSEPAPSASAPAASAPSASAPAASEAAWTAKDIQLLVAAKAGGGTDVIGRIIAQGMSDAVGKNVVVVNQTEGGGAVCFNNVQTASEKADMMGFLIPSYFTSYISGVHDISPVEDVQYPIVLENISGCTFVVVSAKSPFNTIEELVDYIKAHPGEVTFGTQLGTNAHYLFADFCQSQGLEVEYLESGSDSDKVTGLMGDLFEVSTINANQANQYVAAGELKALVAMAPTGGGFDKEMLTALADVRTVVECGYAPLRTTSFFCLAAPTNVPESVMAEVSAAVEAAVADPTVAEQCAKAGYGFKIYNSTEAGEFMKNTFDAYSSLGKDLGLSAR